MSGVNPKTQEADWPRKHEARETGDRTEGRSGQDEQGYAHQGILLVGLIRKADEIHKAGAQRKGNNAVDDGCELERTEEKCGLWVLGSSRAVQDG